MSKNLFEGTFETLNKILLAKYPILDMGYVFKSHFNIKKPSVK